MYLIHFYILLIFSVISLVSLNANSTFRDGNGREVSWYEVPTSFISIIPCNLTSIGEIGERSGRFRRGWLCESRFSGRSLPTYAVTLRSEFAVRELSRSVPRCAPVLEASSSAKLGARARSALSSTGVVETPSLAGIYTCELRLLHTPGRAKGLTTRDRDTYAWEKHRRVARWWMNKYSRANKLRVTVGVRAYVHLSYARFSLHRTMHSTPRSATGLGCVCVFLLASTCARASCQLWNNFICEINLAQQTRRCLFTAFPRDFRLYAYICIHMYAYV